MMIIQNEFQIGQTVYLKTDESQAKRMVVIIQILPNELLYCLNCGPANSWHYEIEIAAEPVWCSSDNKGRDKNN